MSTFTIIFIVLTALCWGSAALFDKLALKYLSAVDMFFARLILMMVLFIPFLIWRWEPTKAAVMASEKISILFVFLSITTAMTGVYFYLKAMSGNEVSKIVPLCSAYPLVTLILAVVFLSEGFTWFKLLGTLLIASGVWILAI